MSYPKLYTAMITPFTEDLEVNYAAAADLAEQLIANGSDGIIVCGTTGEAPTLTTDEKLQLFSLIKERVGDRAEVWAGTGTNNTAATVQLSKKAEKCGVHGVLVVSPYYNKPSQNGLYEHFKKIADSISLPVMMYNIPGRTSCNILPATVQKLAAIENITALKESTGDMDQMSLLFSLAGDRLDIYSGDDSNTLPMLALGAKGVVSVASHLAGPEIRLMMEKFFAGDIAGARALHLKLFPLFKGLFITSNPVPLKAALNLKGFPAGGLRLPLVNASEDEQQIIKKMLTEIGLLK
jgi:4-hydroxy-tetrahydrodipicolinate synthase